ARNGGVHQEGPRVGLGEADPRTSRPAGWSTRHQEGCARYPHADAGGLRGDEEDGARRQMLGAGREGFQAAEIREWAGLWKRHATPAALPGYAARRPAATAAALRPACQMAALSEAPPLSALGSAPDVGSGKDK